MPRARTSDADDAAFLSSSYGLTPDDWQFTVLKGWLGRRADGKWSSPRCGLAVPRQNGKNGALEMRELFGMVALGEKFLHTAHEVKTARKAYIRLLSFFENRREYPELAELVKEIRKTNGQEAIVLHNGGSVEFVARSKGSGRGFTVDTLVLDEAQELGEDPLAALLPTISAAPSGNPQTIWTGTPPGPNMDGAVFTRVRDAGVKGTDRRLCWFEWSCSGAIDLDDRAHWAGTNPGLGRRVNLETLVDEREAFDNETFARERLGMWQSATSGRVIDPMAWAGCADPQSKPTEQIVFALDVSPDRSRASVAVASWREDGLPHVEVIRNDNGTGWMVEYLVDRVERWHPLAVVLDAAGPAGGLITSLQAKGVEPQLMSGREMGQACGELYDLVVEKRLRHLNQPLLNVAVDGARKRTLQDAWAWHRRDSSIDITPLVAVTQALHGLLVTGAKPKRERTGEAVFI